MRDGFAELKTRTLPAGTPVYRFNQGLPERVTMKDPAVNVMTDLRRTKAITIAPHTPIDGALQKMINAEVRLLVVTNAAGEVVGVISARDILGEKPVSYISRERVARSEIQVSHVMTPREQIDVLGMEDVYRSRVGDVVATLRERGRQHTLVLDMDERIGGPVVRGIFSLTQIGSQLGVEIQSNGRVQSFADVEALLNAG